MSKESSYTLKTEFENKIISRGSNYPSIDISKNSLNILCVLLHQNIAKEDIIKRLEISEIDFELKIEALKREGLVKVKQGEAFLSFPCITNADGIEFYRLSKDVSDKIADLLIKKLDDIVQETYKVDCFKNYHFEELSFFLLSGVSLDFIQIDYVEKEFLKIDRPARGGNNYYFSLMQKTSSTKESFGIYGNHCESFGEISYCIYGNERYSTKNFITMSEEEVKGRFDISKENLLKLIISSIKHGTESEPFILKVSSELKMLNDDRSILIISGEDYHSLHNIANIITSDLIKILSDYRPKFIEAYNESPYYQKTTFEEYFIWYYHFLYTQITETLINRGVINKPKSGLFNYIMN